MLCRSVRQLAQEPDLSEVETFLVPHAPVLTEDSVTTIHGVLASALSLANATSAALLRVWRERRASPSLLLQPKEQWRDGASTRSRGFAGYKPGSMPFTADMMVANDEVLTRLKAAALDDGSRVRWSSFD